MHCKLRVRNYAQKSDAIIAATQDNYDGIRQIWQKNSIIIPEVGLLSTKENQRQQRKEERLKIAWSGQHTPGKALNLLLEAIRLLPYKENVELHVIGQGKYTKRWKTEARKYQLDNIIWHGWVERDKAIDVMSSCHLFCITSLADLTSTVLLEALSNGLPVIALNHCGFANVITEACGIKIDIHSKKQVVGDFAKAIEKVYTDEPYRMALSQGAIHRAKDFAWEKKAELINSIYNQIIKQ